MSYVVQTGETIAAVTRKLDTSFRALKRSNPNAFGQTKDGRWFLKAGYKLETQNQTQSNSVAENASSAAPVQNSNAALGKTYTVQNGETIKTVTNKLGYSFQELKAANPEAVGQLANGRHFFYAGATLKVPGGFQDSLETARNQSNNQPVTALKTTESSQVSGGSSDVSYTDTEYPERNRGVTTRSYESEYREAETATAERSNGVPGYQSTGFVRSSDAGPIFNQNPVIGSNDFAFAGQQSLTQTKYVLEKPLTQDLNLAFGFVNERHDTEDFSHSRSGLDNKGVTMGLRFRF
jgi:hypothetical protein